MEKNHETANVTPNQLDTLRERIDYFDQQILALVMQRTVTTVEVAREKAAQGISTMVPGRHSEVVGNYMNGVTEEGPFDAQDAVKLAETVMAISRKAQDQYRATAAEGTAV